MPQRIIKFTRGVPPAESFPTGQLTECFSSAMQEYGSLIQQYAPASGFIPLREAIAAQHQTRMEQVLVGQGSLQLLDLLARLSILPGDLVYVELPSYDRTITSLRRVKANVIGIPMGKEGMDTTQLEQRLQSGERPKFIYIIPDFQNPSGSQMSLERRQTLARLAQEYDFWIIEDSPYRQLRYQGQEIPSIYSLAPERVMLMSSFSKTICPGLRVGYMVVPQPLIGPMAKMAEDTYINSSYINQAIAYEFIRRGWFEENLSKIKQLYRQRMEKMLADLTLKMAGLGEWTTPEGGFFIGLRLNKKIPIQQWMDKTKNAGLVMTDGRGFFANGEGEDFVRLPFCGLSPEEIEAGIDALANVITGI